MGSARRGRVVGKRVLAALCAAVVSLSATGCGAGAVPSPTNSHDLTVYHWWTAGGERQAMTKIEEDFGVAYPDITIHDNPAAGGGGITLKTVMQGMLAANMPPDSFQSLAGGELKTYVDGGYLANVDDIWAAQGLNQKYPAVLGRMVTFNGHKMAIPVSIHRANWLFYNTRIFSEYGLDSAGDVDELISDCAVLDLRHITPIGLGTRDKWTAVFLFDAVLLSVAGPDVYERFYTGLIDARTDVRIRDRLQEVRGTDSVHLSGPRQRQLERHAATSRVRPGRDDGPGRLCGPAADRCGLPGGQRLGGGRAFRASRPRSS